MFPFSAADAVQHSGPIPQKSEVVIVGGGVIGVSTALYLAHNNIEVTLLEKGRIAAEQSSRNWGWIRKQGRDADELPIVMEACRLWQELAQECGEDIGLQQTGVTYLARTPKDMAGFEDFMKIAAAHALDTRLIDGEAVRRMIPGMARNFAGAMVTPSDMRAEPWLAVPALARLAVRRGVRIIENCAVRAVDTAAGAVQAVFTEHGKIETSNVLVAGGAWSSLFLHKHGVSIPQLSVRATVAATEPMPELHAGAVAEDDIAFRRRQDGGYTLAPGGSNLLYVGPDAFRHATKYMPALKAHPFGTRYAPMAPSGYPDAWGTPRDWAADEVSPFERMRVLNPAPGKRELQAIKRGFDTLFAQAKPVRLKTTWAGMIDAMPDVVPVVDRVATINGLFVATGMSGHNLHRFRLSRFAPGNTIRPGPAL